MILTKEKIRPVLFISILLISISCQKEEKIAEKYSEQDVYSYIAFKPGSKWELTNGTDTLTIESDIDKGFKRDKKKGQTKLKTVLFGEIDSNHVDIALISTLKEEKSNTSMELKMSINTSDQYIDQEFPFWISDTVIDPVNLQLYFGNTNLQSGKTFNDCAIIYLNSNSTLKHYRKIFIAPKVGVVKIETNTGDIYELLKNESETIKAEEIEFYSE